MVEAVFTLSVCDPAVSDWTMGKYVMRHETVLIGFYIRAFRRHSPAAEQVSTALTSTLTITSLHHGCKHPA